MANGDLILGDEDRSKLDGIVGEMTGNGEADADIQFVVNDFKSKYGVKKKESTQVDQEDTGASTSESQDSSQKRNDNINRITNLATETKQAIELNDDNLFKLKEQIDDPNTDDATRALLIEQFNETEQATTTNQKTLEDLFKQYKSLGGKKGDVSTESEQTKEDAKTITIADKKLNKISEITLKKFDENEMFQEADPNSARNKETYLQTLVKKGYDEKALYDAVGERYNPKFMESIKNTGSNIKTSLKGVVPRVNILTADVFEAVLGKENAQKVYSDPFLSAGEGPRDIDEVRNEAYKKLKGLSEEVKPTISLYNSIKTGDAAGILAGTIDAMGAIVSTGIPAIATGGAGLVTEVVGGTIVDFNETKAEELGVTVEELHKSGEYEVGVPMAIGTFASGMEMFGIKGVGKMINQKLKEGGTKIITNILVQSNKEGVTEWLQSGLETYNKELAKGKSQGDALSSLGDTLLSEKGLEAYIQGVAGSAGVGAVGVGAKKLLPKKKEELETEVIKAKAEGREQDAEMFQKKVDEVDAEIDALDNAEAETVIDDAQKETEVEIATTEKARLEDELKRDDITPAGKEVIKEVIVKIDQILKEDAVQEPSTKEVPIRDETSPSKEVGKQVPDEKPTKESKEEAVVKPTEDKKPSPVEVTEKKERRSEDIAKEKGVTFKTEAEADRFIAEESESPLELAETYARAEPLRAEPKLENASTKLKHIDSTIEKANIKLTNAEFHEIFDKNVKTESIAKEFIDNKRAVKLDTKLQEISEDAGVEITSNDFRDYLERKMQIAVSPKDIPLRVKLKDRFFELTGKDLTPKLAETTIHNEAKKAAETQKVDYAKFTSKEETDFAEAEQGYYEQLRKEEATDGDRKGDGVPISDEKAREGEAKQKEPVRTSGVKMSETRRIAERFGFGEIDIERFTEKGLIEEAQKRLKDPKTMPALLDKLESGKERATNSDIVTMSFAIADLEAKIEKNPTNASIDALERIRKVSDPEGTLAGQSLRARQIVAPVEDTLADWLMDMKGKMDVPKLSDTEIKSIQKDYKKFDDSRKETNAEQEVANEFLGEQKADATVQEVIDQRVEEGVRKHIDEMFEKNTPKKDKALIQKGVDKIDSWIASLDKVAYTDPFLITPTLKTALVMAKGVLKLGMGVNAAIEAAMNHLRKNLKDDQWDASVIEAKFEEALSETRDGLKEKKKKTGKAPLTEKDIAAKAAKALDKYKVDTKKKLKSLRDQIEKGKREKKVSKPKAFEKDREAKELERQKNELEAQLKAIDKLSQKPKRKVTAKAKAVERDVVTKRKLTLPKEKPFKFAIEKTVEAAEKAMLKIGIKTPAVLKTKEQIEQQKEIKDEVTRRMREAMPLKPEKKELTPEELREQYYKLVDKAKDRLANGLTRKNSKDVMKIFHNLIARGEDSAPRIASKISKDVGLGTLKARDVYDVINGRYAESRSLTEYERKLQEARKESKLISQLRDLEAGKTSTELDNMPVKERQEQSALTKSIKGLADRIKTIKEADPEQALLKRGKMLDALDKRYKAEADRIEKKIDAGDFLVKPKIPLLEDAELRKRYPEKFKALRKSKAKTLKLKEDFEVKKIEAELATRSKSKIASDIAKKTLASIGKIMASFDTSFGGIHALPVLFSNRKVWWKTYKEGWKQLLSESRYKEKIQEPELDPELSGMVKRSGLDFFDMDDMNKEDREGLQLQSLLDKHKIPTIKVTKKGKVIYETPGSFKMTLPKATLTERREILGVSFNIPKRLEWKKETIEHINIGKYTTRPFERHFVGMGNALRLELFLNNVQPLLDEGKTIDTHPKEFKEVADWINNTTGRGKMHPLLDNEFIRYLDWAPKLLASGANALGIGDAVAALEGREGYYKRMSPRQRKLARKQITKTFRNVGLILLAAELAGADVDWDLSSPTFASVKVGDWRFTPLGRYTGILKNLIQISLGGRTMEVEKTLPDGSTYTVREFVPKDRGDMMLRYKRGKLSPHVGIGVDLLTGQDFNYNDVTIGSSIMGVNPLTYKALVEDVETSGVGETFLLAPFISAGMGISNDAAYQIKKNIKEEERKATRIEKALLETAGYTEEKEEYFADKVRDFIP